ncbi:MAG: sigma 54-interacting transcriptional regulator [Deltaproteobacteria bacterium]|nr:sigma 54-interacting transcriptional regulator [Deltaproteobacteria bacterium]
MADSMQQTVMSACDHVGLVGSELRKMLAHEIPAKILLRRGRDVVLLSGATGAGKERIAQVAHEAARRTLGRKGELVEVSCANLGRGLFESELFGHRRGAYTGADHDHDGLLGRAQGGTLVLDEVQSLAAEDQARLLRFLGEREYRSVGASDTHVSDALVILASNRDLRGLVGEGKFRRDLLDRALAKISVPSLYERRRDIGELSQAFALEAARELGAEDFIGLTRRALADVETAVVRAREVSVRRLKEIIRDAVFALAADALPEAIESDMLLPILEAELAFQVADRDLEDQRELAAEYDLLIGRARLTEIVHEHKVSKRTLDRLCGAIKTVIDEMHDQPRSYRNVVERTNRLAKVALWLVSGAATQAEFRKFFGSLEAEMPTKSVAHQIYYEVFGDDAKGRTPAARRDPSDAEDEL